MRITQNTIFNNLRTNLMNNSESLLQAQQTVATQKRIINLSDNPVDGGRVLDLNGAISRSDQYLSNVSRVLSSSDIQDSTLDQANTLVSQAKSLLLKEANQATSTATTREATRIETSILTSQLVQVGNTRFDGKYIFSGFQTDTPAFNDAAVSVIPTTVTGGAVATSQKVADASKMTYHNYQVQFTAANQFDIVDTTSGVTIAPNQAYASGGTISFDGLNIQISNNPGAPAAGDIFTVTTTPPGQYNGDSQVQNVEVQPGTTVQQNIPGNRIFQGAGISGGVNIFSIMNQINTALQTNDRPAISNLLDQLDKASAQISDQRAKVGSQVNLVTTVKDRQTDIKTNLESLRSDLEDIDVADAITNLNKQQNVYNATLGAAAKIVQQSLLDFLR